MQRFCHLNLAQVADLYMTVRQIAERLAGYFSATSLTISMQDGEDAGQSVSVSFLLKKCYTFRLSL